MSRIMVLLVTLAIASSVAHAGPASKKPVYKIHAFEVPPVFDGETEKDPAWQNLPFATGFVKIKSDELFEEQRQTRFRMGITEDALHVGIMCLEPDISKISAEAKEGEVGICSDDGIELFIYPDEADTYFHFMIGATGTRWNGRDLHSPDLPLGNWQAKTYHEHRYYSIEIKIPFKLLGTIPEKGAVWTGSIGRNVVLGGDRYCSTWSKHQIGFHERESFGEFHFMDDMASEEARRKRIEDTRLKLIDQLERVAAFRKRMTKVAAADRPLRDAIKVFLEKHDALRQSVKESSNAETTRLKELLISTKELFVEADTLLGRALLVKLIRTP